MIQNANLKSKVPLKHTIYNCKSYTIVKSGYSKILSYPSDLTDYTSIYGFVYSPKSDTAMRLQAKFSGEESTFKLGTSMEFHLKSMPDGLYCYASGGSGTTLQYFGFYICYI